MYIYMRLRQQIITIPEMIKTFGMNPKNGGSGPPQVKTISVSKTSKLSQEHSFRSQKWMLLPVHS